MNKKLIIALALLAVVALAADIPAPTTASCGTGKVWSNDWCAPCASGCDACTDAYGCTLCTYTYQRVSSTDETLGCYQPQVKIVNTDSSLTTSGITAGYTAPTSCSSGKDCVDLTGKTVGCTACATNFGVQANACAACPSNCQACTFAAATGAGTCTKCATGYYMKGTDCTVCPSTITNCLQCDAAGATCAICSPGYFPVNGTCVVCASPAASCDSAGKILSCGSGYFLDVSTPATPKCTACSANCLTCTSATACTTCNWSGYYLASGACTACPQTSAKYCTASAVIQCNDNFAIVGNTCVANIANCAKHTSATICATCRKNYVFSAGACVLPGDATVTQVKYCTAATSATDATAAAVCTTCKANPTTGTTRAYVIDATTKACVACPDNATACTSTNNVFSAVTCVSGFVLNQAGTGCLDCSGIKSTYCKQNTTANATKPKCIQADGSTICAITASGTADTTVVNPTYVPSDACADGYMLTAASAPEGLTCTACAAGCKTCETTNASKCITCFPGYYLTLGSGSGTCTKCTGPSTNNCSSCSAPKRQLTATTTEWVATVTTACVIIPTSDTTTIAQGTQSTSTGIVTSCATGYLLDTTGNSNAGACKACKDFVTAATDCTTCSGTPTAAATAYVCTLCGTSTNTLQGTATLTTCTADANCGAIQASKCLWCKLGYNIDTTGKCAACTNSACTFSCPLPTVPGAGNNNNANAAKAASSGSFLTFAFSAIVLILAALF